MMIGLLAQHGTPVAPMPAASPMMLVFSLVILGLHFSISAWLYVRRRRTVDSTDPACGQCGYFVRGMTTFFCPECGADLRVVGILKSQGEGSRLTDLAMSGWSALCSLIGIGFTFVLYNDGAPNGNFGQWASMTLFAAISASIGGAVFIRILRGWVSAPVDTQGLLKMQAAGAALPTTTQGTGESTSRTLSIMFIDMAGYTSRATTSSRDGLLMLVRRSRELVEPVLARRRGMIVKTMGDGFVVTFESATDAVLSGTEIQQSLAAGNKTATHDDRIELRIGVATGEVVLEEKDVYGEAVNLAARIQQAAMPGQVLFSEGTWHAMTRSEVPHELAGEFELKGIAGAIRIHRALDLV